jgi:hypothetical protein
MFVKGHWRRIRLNPLPLCGVCRRPGLIAALACLSHQALHVTAMPSSARFFRLPVFGPAFLWGLAIGYGVRRSIAATRR